MTDQPKSAQDRALDGVWPNFIAPQKYENPAEGWEDPELPDFAVIWKAAREVGYTVGLHGSMKRDVDLIAVPWTEDAQPVGRLVTALCVALGAKVLREPAAKPHGRISVILDVPTKYAKHIDLSILPRAIDTRPAIHPDWQKADTVPPVPTGGEDQYVLAVFRVHSGKTYSFAASYLNAYELEWRDGCKCGGETCDGCEDGCPTTGWFTITGDDAYDYLYERLTLYEGDKIMGWCEVPQFAAAPEPPIAPDAEDEGHDEAMKYINGANGMSALSTEECVAIYLRARGILRDGADMLGAPIPKDWKPC